MSKRKRYLVTYDLTYDNGNFVWTEEYNRLPLAKIVIFWKKYISSWGGDVTVVDTWRESC